MPASRSLIALLIGTVAFFALYMFALKGGSSSNGSSSSQGLGQYQSAINQAHQAVATSGANDAASGNDGTGASSSTSTTSGDASASHTSSSAPSSSTATAPKPAASSHAKAKPAPHLTAKVGAHNKATLARLSTVQHAISAHKTVAMLFYNPSGADDTMVKQQLAGVSTDHGKVVKLTIPLSEAANFTPVTQQVPVNLSPTLVVIAPNGQVQEIVGYTDQFEITQRVDDALAAK